MSGETCLFRLAATLREERYASQKAGTDLLRGVLLEVTNFWCAVSLSSVCVVPAPQRGC